MPELACHLCGAVGLQEFPAFADFRRVTSDAKPWPYSGRLAWCPVCDCAQAVLDEEWYRQAEAIYATYDMNLLSEGREQNVFDPQTGAPSPRSDYLMKQLLTHIAFPNPGTLLDVGCGTGAFLSAFGKVFPEWELFGHDINDRSRNLVERIPGVRKLFVGSFSEVPGTYRVISLIHALEHIANPCHFLTQVWDRLTDDGTLLIQVPDCSAGPFFYLIADHATHFFPTSLRELLESQGYAAVAAGGWVAKELSLAVRKRSARVVRSPRVADRVSFDAIAGHIAWLREQSALLRSLRSAPTVGIFGTSIAGTWAFSELDDRAAFFVDEDPHKIGKKHLGRPILSPKQIPSGSDVYLPFPRRIASSITARLDRPHVRWHLPSDLPGN